MEFQVSILNFEGPMDLLLHLVKETKLDIYEIKMSEIIDKYLDYIHSLQNLNIDISSSFLVMAATLIHIKSKKLIGKVEEEVDDEYEINSEEDLKNKIILYEQYKELTKDFEKLHEKREEIHTKLPENLKKYESSYELFNESGLTSIDLFKALEEVMARMHYKEPKNTKITRREISVASRKVWIRKKLEEKEKCDFFELFEKNTKEYIIATFLAILEMSKESMLKITQENTFDKIWIWRI